MRYLACIASCGMEYLIFYLFLISISPNMTEFERYKDTGKGTLPDFNLNEKINDPSLYLPSRGLMDAVNVALQLGQPLLLTGEPGTGKTQLAYHLAYYFDLGQPLVFNAQTTSLATELFYRYDALGHFQYSQNQNIPLSMEELEARFIRFNALGEAIQQNKRTVVLIDEIDKAPRDFPNDILFAIEKLRFTIPELGNKVFETHPAKRPIIILTSNSEKNLPDAFLRRVIYYHISPPNENELLQILQAKTEQIPTDLLQIAIKEFSQIRSLPLKKSPSTAELVYWILLLHQIDFPIRLLQNKGRLSNEEIRKLSMSYSILVKSKEDMQTLKHYFLGIEKE